MIGRKMTFSMLTPVAFVIALAAAWVVLTDGGSDGGGGRDGGARSNSGSRSGLMESDWEREYMVGIGAPRRDPDSVAPNPFSEQVTPREFVGRYSWKDLSGVLVLRADGWYEREHGEQLGYWTVHESTLTLAPARWPSEYLLLQVEEYEVHGSCLVEKYFGVTTYTRQP